MFVTRREVQRHTQGLLPSLPFNHCGDQCVSDAVPTARRRHPQGDELNGSVLIRLRGADHADWMAVQKGNQVDGNRGESLAPTLLRISRPLPICQLGAKSIRRLAERLQSQLPPERPVVRR